MLRKNNNQDPRQTQPATETSVLRGVVASALIGLVLLTGCTDPNEAPPKSDPVENTAEANKQESLSTLTEQFGTGVAPRKLVEQIGAEKALHEILSSPNYTMPNEKIDDETWHGLAFRTDDIEKRLAEQQGESIKYFRGIVIFSIGESGAMLIQNPSLVEIPSTEIDSRDVFATAQASSGEWLSIPLGTTRDDIGDRDISIDSNAEIVREGTSVYPIYNPNLTAGEAGSSGQISERIINSDGSFSDTMLQTVDPRNANKYQPGKATAITSLDYEWLFNSGILPPSPPDGGIVIPVGFNGYQISLDESIQKPQD